jgi:hypothetical protein
MLVFCPLIQAWQTKQVPTLCSFKVVDRTLLEANATRFTKCGLEKGRTNVGGGVESMELADSTLNSSFETLEIFNKVVVVFKIEVKIGGVRATMLLVCVEVDSKMESVRERAFS